MKKKELPPLLETSVVRNKKRVELFLHPKQVACETIHGFFVLAWLIGTNQYKYCANYDDLNALTKHMKREKKIPDEFKGKILFGWKSVEVVEGHNFVWCIDCRGSEPLLLSVEADREFDNNGMLEFYEAACLLMPIS